MSGADLRGIKLNGARLGGANLKYTNLHNATLWSADFNDADLTGVNLSGAGLSEATLTNTILTNTNLCDANLNRIKYNKKTNFLGVEYNEKTLENLKYDPDLVNILNKKGIKIEGDTRDKEFKVSDNKTKPFQHSYGSTNYYFNTSKERDEALPEIEKGNIDEEWLKPYPTPTSHQI